MNLPRLSEIIEKRKHKFMDRLLQLDYFTVVLNVYSANVFLQFLQRGRIACNAERCISHGNSVSPSVTCWYCTQTNEDRIMRSSL